MRLVGIIQEEQEALRFSSYLKKEGIANSLEPTYAGEGQKASFQIWIYDEDHFTLAQEALEHFKQDAKDPRYAVSEQLSAHQPDNLTQIKVEKPPEAPLQFILTYATLFLCTIIFILNTFQEGKIEEEKGPLARQISLSPIQQTLLFDYPAAFAAFEALLETYPLKSYNDVEHLPPKVQELFEKAENLPYWKGIFPLITEWKTQGWQYVQSIPLFEKIRQGELWRLFTPCIVHRDLLHILFNMAWLWFLGRQIEERLPRLKMLLLFLILGVVSNVAQYLMTGPFFLGFSGVVMGMVGFIWMRQKKAPWEGYPLHPSTILFIIIFIGAMILLEMGSWMFQLFSSMNLSSHIANTAHIVGALTGMLLGRSHFFSRGHLK